MRLYTLFFSIISFTFSLFAQEIEQNHHAFYPGKIWNDNRNIHINAHGGGVLHHGGKYYWFGEHKGERSNSAFVGVTCYSSANLYDWTYENVALSVETDPRSEIVEGCIIERPKVIYNAKTKKFVMYFHLELKDKGYAAARTGVAVSDKVTGPYRYLKSCRPNAERYPVNMSKEQRQLPVKPSDFPKQWTDEWKKAVVDGMFVRRDFAGGQMSRDMTLFVDDDEKAYHIYASEENLTLHIAELTDDYLDYTGKYIRIAPAGHNEAPAVFKKDGKYFMITSGCTGWEPNAARLFTSGSIMGNWTEHPNPCRGEGAELTFHSQSTYILPVAGKKDAFIFMADRWTPKNPIDGRYIWLPVRFENGLPVLEWCDKWDLSGLSPVGWAANSVNTAIFRSNSLVSFGDTQLMAYYDGEGFMCLAKRKINSDSWKISRTKYRGNMQDAHNCISIMTDGEGYLHVSWNLHNSPLNYAKSKAPLSLEPEEMQAMTGANENKLTYPAFYRLNSGNLLFLYRDGGSGNGNLIVNAYDVKTRKWTRLHDNLISGEGLRNAYWQACSDANGTIHISWVWRETPDVATNHDMCYARSTDGGKTWTNSKGKRYKLPITAQKAEIASKIPPNSELINQTSMTADSDGNPYISTCYRGQDSNVPQFHVIYTDKGGKWKDISLGFRKIPFSLNGAGTKKIPVSRPLIVCSSPKNGTKQWRIFFRDEERKNRISMAVCDDLSENRWTVSDLTDYSVGDWEPTFDTELWKNENILHLFVQKTLQNDGERNSDLDAQPISVLDVSPRMSCSQHCEGGSRKQSKEEILAIIKKVNDRWQTLHPEHGNAFWHTAAYHTGNMAAYEVTGDERYRKYSEAWAEKNEWKGAKSDNKNRWKYRYGETDDLVLFGDWQTCFQTYADLYCLQPDKRKIARAREVMEYEMSTPENDYWWWADGLYMVMPVMTKLYRITGNNLYLQKLYEYFSYAKQLMYDEEAGLFYRDAKYIYPKHQTNSGKKDFWSRGNGWVFAGLAKVLQDLPENDIHRNEYIRIYQSMAKTLKNSLQPKGYWARSILDINQAPGFETSGTAFFTYGLLWGMNKGLLDKNEYESVAQKAWQYLTETALQPDGTVGYVQPVGERADQHIVNAETTADFGVGAFLLAASEKARFVDNAHPLQGNDRQYWSDLAYKIAAPVLGNMSKGELSKNMQLELSPTWDGRDKRVSYMEAFGRLMDGIAPWLSLPDDDTEEGKRRKQLREWALKSYANAVNPENPDYLLWRKEGQPLVDAAYIAGSFLRAPKQLWEPLDDITKKRYIEEFQQLRRVDPPYSNWLLFSATVETFLLSVNARCDMYRIHSAIRKIEEWYTGDGWYSDGEHFAFDYYNSYVIHPMYVQVLKVLTERKMRLRDKSYETALKRMQRFGIILERFISPEGSFPVFGRSMTYRLGVFQPLALLAWKEQLPNELPEGQVRAAMTAAMKRMFSVDGNFNDNGFLQLGFVGHQPNLADWYTNNGSLYLTSEVFLPLGLPADHSFWTSPARDWTAKKAWTGADFPKDHAIKH